MNLLDRCVYYKDIAVDVNELKKECQNFHIFGITYFKKYQNSCYCNNIYGSYFGA